MNNVDSLYKKVRNAITEEQEKMIKQKQSEVLTIQDINNIFRLKPLKNKFGVDDNE